MKRLPKVVSALNNKVTSLTGKKPAGAIKEKAIAAKPSTKYLRPVGQKEKKASLPRKCPVFVSTWWVRWWCRKSNRSNLVFESLQHWKVCDKTKFACPVWLARRSQARLRAWRTAAYSSKHRVTTWATLKLLQFQHLLMQGCTRKHLYGSHHLLSIAFNQTGKAKSCFHACHRSHAPLFEECWFHAITALYQKAFPCTVHALFVSWQRTFLHPYLFW